MAFGTASGGGVNSTTVNTQSWLVTGGNWSSIVTRPENQFLSITERILARATAYDFAPAVIDQATWVSLVDQADNDPAHIISLPGGDQVVVMRRKGPLQLSGDIIVNQKVILIVDESAASADDGEVRMDGTVTLGLGPPSGFLAILAKNDMVVEGTVGAAGTDNPIDDPTYPGHLQGIFFSGGTFDTSSDVKQLKVEGTVIGIGGVTLGRTHEGQRPAEFFEFRPDLTFTLAQVGLRRKVMQELIGP